MTPESRTIIITDIDPVKFHQLSSTYGDILLCTCSTITASYETFVSNAIEFHPVCSSFFVSQQWIEVLYLSDRSFYGIADFRTTAAAQVNQCLHAFCYDWIVTTEERTERRRRSLYQFKVSD